MKGITGSLSLWCMGAPETKRLNRTNTSRPAPVVMQHIRNTSDEPVQEPSFSIPRPSIISGSRKYPLDEAWMQKAKGVGACPETFSPETFSAERKNSSYETQQSSNYYAQYDRNPGGQYRLPITAYAKEKSRAASNFAMANYLLKSIEDEDSFHAAMYALQQNTEFGTPHFQHMVITLAKDHMQKAQNKLLAEEARFFLARSKRGDQSQIAATWLNRKAELDLRMLLLSRLIDDVN